MRQVFVEKIAVFVLLDRNVEQAGTKLQTKLPEDIFIEEVFIEKVLV